MADLGAASVGADADLLLLISGLNLQFLLWPEPCARCQSFQIFLKSGVRTID